MQHYQRLLRQRHFLDLDLIQLRRILEVWVCSLEERARARSRELLGEQNLVHLASRLDGVYPVAGRERIEQCERDCERLGRIARDLDWLTPPEAALRVTEKPNCLRPGLGEISYVAAASGESVPAARLFLPPLGPGEKEGRLRILERALEAGPLGLHLLETRAREAGQSWPRRLHRSAGMWGGWIYYLRELLAEARSQLSVEESAALLLADLRAAQLALLDLDIHSQGLGYEASAERMQGIPGLPAARFDTELTRLSRHPADALAAVIGGRLIGHARDIVVGVTADDTLRGFHDRLLAPGLIAMPLIIQHQFGEAVWDRVIERIAS